MIQHITRKATWKRVFVLFCTSTILGLCIVTMFFGQIKLNADATMDSLTFYTNTTFFQNIELQGEEGRRAYLYLHLIDYLFITQFYSLLAFLTSILLKESAKFKRITFICLIPFLSAIMDLFENIFIDISILLYPNKIILLGQFSGFFTLIKMISIYISFAIIVSLFIVIAFKILKKAITKESHHK